MSDKAEVNNSGLGLSSILTIIFVIAKLAGFITWSWWVVFAPVLVSMAIGIAVLVGVLVALGVGLYVASK